MKFKAFIFALLLLVGYHFIAEFWKKSGNEIVADQGQWSQNSMKSQTFLYDFNPPKYNCIVGTSLALRLERDSLPSHYYNLCLNGQNVLDGLMVLKQKTNLPDTLFIETNFITRGNNEDFVNKIVGSEYKVLLKQKLCFLQEKYLPIGWVANYLQMKMGGGISGFYRRCYVFVKNKMHFGRVDDANGINPENSEAQLFNDVLMLRQAHMSLETDIEKTNQQFAETKAILQELEKRSVKLIFFEMPIHCTLVESKLMTMNREMIRMSFSPSRYRYLNLGTCEEFETTDALHLNTESAIKCTNAFINSIIRLR